jgi:hypothetical protein
LYEIPIAGISSPFSSFKQGVDFRKGPGNLLFISKPHEAEAQVAVTVKAYFPLSFHRKSPAPTGADTNKTSRTITAAKKKTHLDFGLSMIFPPERTKS